MYLLFSYMLLFNSIALKLFKPIYSFYSSLHFSLLKCYISFKLCYMLQTTWYSQYLIINSHICTMAGFYTIALSLRALFYQRGNTTNLLLNFYLSVNVFIKIHFENFFLYKEFNPGALNHWATSSSTSTSSSTEPFLFFILS